MNDRNDAFRLSGMLLLIILATALWKQQPFRDSRPTETIRPGYDATIGMNVDARLWQDPFQAMENHGATTPVIPDGHGDHSPRQLYAAIQDRIYALQGSEAFEVMAVMLDGSPYFESGESRRRTRYAVLSAFHALTQTAHYSVENPEHIGFFEPCRGKPPGTSHCKDAAGLPPQVVYEWLIAVVPGQACPQPNVCQKTKHVLVLWLNSNDFGSEPLRGIQNLLDTISLDSEGRATPLFNSATVIGPISSLGLKTLVVEAAEPNFPVDSRYDLEIISPRATAHDKALVSNLSLTKDVAQAFLDGKKRGRVHLIRPTVTDDHLARAINRELQYRQEIGAIIRNAITLNRNYIPIPAIDPTRHVVLISEWDTFYGLHLPNTMAGALQTSDCNDTGYTATLCIHRFSYLRGLGGEKPPDRAPIAQRGTSASTLDSGAIVSARSQLAQSIERPEGDSQYDYLRRLSQRIVTLDRELDLQSAGTTISAIGVLGSDLYDKLLILQALRRDFPEVLFFTTDIDARMLHASENDWTRNLIVASAFGLELHPEFQRDIPPFRDSYQTATFLATQLALLGGDSRLRQNLEKRMSPHLFEIGRSRAVDLNPLPANEDPACRPPLDCRSFYPVSIPLWSLRHLATGLFLGILLIFILSVIWRGLREWVQHAVRLFSQDFSGRLNAMFLALLAITVLAGLGYNVYWAGMGEPWALAEGVSIWPSIFIRFLALVVTLYFVREANWDNDSTYLNRKLTSIAIHFKLDGKRPPSSRYRSFFRSWWKCLTLYSPLFSEQKEINASSLWDGFLYQNSLRKWRARTLATAYLIFTIGLVFAFGPPNSPARGITAFVIDKLVLLSLIPAFSYLLFLVFDITRCCSNLMKIFTDPGVVILWSQDNGETQDIHCYWTQIHLAGVLTAAIDRLLYAPFFVAALLVVARSRLFDNWVTPPGLWMVFGISFLILVIRVYVLGKTARTLRDNSLKHLESIAAGELAESARLLREQIKNYREGSFAEWTERPLVRGLLGLAGTGGLLQLAEYLLFGAT